MIRHGVETRLALRGGPPTMMRCAGDDWVASATHEFLLKLLLRFPQYYARPLWLTGESYAGHYIPLLASKILEYSQFALNLQGYAIGPPASSLRPEHQI